MQEISVKFDIDAMKNPAVSLNSNSTGYNTDTTSSSAGSSRRRHRHRCPRCKVEDCSHSLQRTYGPSQSTTQKKAGTCRSRSPHGAREKRLSVSPRTMGGNCSQNRETTMSWANRMSDGKDNGLGLRHRHHLVGRGGQKGERGLGEDQSGALRHAQ